MKPFSSITISRVARFATGALAGAATLVAAGGTFADAQVRHSGHITEKAPTVQAEGPNYTYNAAFQGAVVTVKSIDLPVGTGSIIILNGRSFPDSVRGKRFGAHVHAGSCSPDAASSGPHYANPAGDKTKSLATREIWLDFTVDGLGRAVSIANVDWKIRAGEANSVVIHAEGTNEVTGASGARVMCTNIALGSAPLAHGADEKEAFTYLAVGVQIYECRVANGVASWAFVAPRADLFNAKNELVGSHGAGPFWAHNDGSRVVGVVRDRVDAPTATAIPWLLLTTRSTGLSGRFRSVTSIKRINTVGGVAPTTGCLAIANAGARAEVPYTSDYVFFQSA